MNRIIFLLFILSLSCCKYKNDCETNPFTNSGNIISSDFSSAKRNSPKEVQPAILKKVQYSAPQFGNNREDLMGFVVAKDLSNDSIIWKKQIYNVTYDSTLEQDVQWTYIDSLIIKCDYLFIHTEENHVYKLSLADTVVTKIE